MTNEKAISIREGLAEELNFCSLEEIVIVSKLIAGGFELEDWDKPFRLNLTPENIQGRISDEQVEELIRKAAMIVVEAEEDEGVTSVYPLFSLLEYRQARREICVFMNPTYDAEMFERKVQGRVGD